MPQGFSRTVQEFKPGSLVFVATSGPVVLNDISKWWKCIDGAYWRHPECLQTSIDGKENHPFVQVSWDDANAYCKLAGKRLPTEKGKQFFWRKEPSLTIFRANLWQDGLPYENIGLDRFFTTAPVKSFSPDGYRIYDIIGNV